MTGVIPWRPSDYMINEFLSYLGQHLASPDGDYGDNCMKLILVKLSRLSRGSEPDCDSSAVIAITGAN